MELTPLVVIILFLTGMFVGFINTLSAGGSIISVSLFLFMGMPPDVVNATNRVSILIQSITSSATYYTQGVLDIKRTLKLSIPIVIGSLAGSYVATFASTQLLEYAFGVVLLLMLFFMNFDPKKLLNDNHELLNKGTTFWKCIVFFLIGFYGGFIQVGTGFFLMIAGVVIVGMGIVKTNAMKVTVMAIYTIATLIVFACDHSVDWKVGLVHGAGSVIGAYVGSIMGIKKGVEIVKWVTLFVILITLAKLLGIIDLMKNIL